MVNWEKLKEQEALNEFKNKETRAMGVRNWEAKLKKRKIWITIIAFFSALLLAYISGNLLCKVGLTDTKKLFSYGWGKSEDDIKTENQSKLPKDYIEIHKKVKENVWIKNFGKKKITLLKEKLPREK